MAAVKTVAPSIIFPTYAVKDIKKIDLMILVVAGKPGKKNAIPVAHI